jgi:hypothetical protein
VLFIFNIIIAIAVWLQPVRHYIPENEVYTYVLGDTKKSVVVSRYGDEKEIVMINLHDDEQTSVKAAQKVLEHTGGILIRIENDSSRNISFSIENKKYSFDPNRIFTDEGAANSLKRFNNDQPAPANIIRIVRTFADSLLAKIPPATETLIALHNNSESDSASTLSIYSYAPGGSEAQEAIQVYIHYEQDRDDFFYATTYPLFSKVMSQGFNVLLQKQKGMTNDGSLSVFMAFQNKAYINVEAQHHHLDEQTKMIKALLK